MQLPDESQAEAARKRGARPPGIAAPRQRTQLDATWFDAPICRNCGAALDTPHCGQCGQAKASRFSWRDLRREGWEQWRMFELVAARTLWRLISSPGYVAREYVMGRRKDHMHPLKLLVVLVAVLLLVQNQSYFAGLHSYSTRLDPQMAQMQALMRGYANWSFSTGILAIFIASTLTFRKRLGTNLMEHAVLAVYCQILILAASILNLLPTLVWHDPGFVRDYKDASKWYLYAIKLLVVGVAFKQFFLVERPREWLRLALAALIYVAISLALPRLYAFAILKIVQFQMS